MLEKLDIKSLPSIVGRIAGELGARLPESGPVDIPCYVYESLDYYTPRVIFELMCFICEKSTNRYTIMLGGVLPDMPFRKVSQPLVVGSKDDIIAFFESQNVIETVMMAIERLDDKIRELSVSE